MGKAATSKSPGAKVLESSRSAQDGITATVQSGDPIRQVVDRRAVAVVGSAGVEEVVVNISGDHEELVDQAHEKRLVFARPGGSHRLLEEVVPHTVGDDRDLGFARLVGVTVRGDGDLLHFDQPIEQLREDIGEIPGTFPGAGAVRLVTDYGAERGPIVEDAEAEAVRAVEELAAELFVEGGGVVETDVEAMDEYRDVALLLVLALGKRGKGIRGSLEKGAKFGWGRLFPVPDVVQRAAVAGPIGQPGGVSARAGAVVVSVADEPILGHNRFLANRLLSGHPTKSSSNCRGGKVIRRLPY